VTVPSPGPATIGGTAADQALDWRDQALAALDEGNPVRALDLAARALSTLEAAGLRGGLDEAAVLVARAEIEEALDRFADARATTIAAIAILDRETEDDSDDDSVTLWCQAQERLAGLERLSGDFAAAAARLRAAADRASAALGENSLAVVSAANSLGVVCKHMADFDAAEAAYRRAQAAAAGLPDPDPLLEAALLHNLGGLAHSRGDPATGIPLAERGAALRTQMLGPGHPDVAGDLNALGALYHLDGRFADAERSYRQALTAFEDAYGPDHCEVGMTCANLAVLHSDQGDFARAESLGRRSLDIFTRVLGEQDAEVGLTLLNLATAVAGQGRTAEAVDLAASAAAILADRLPPGHPHRLAAADALGRYEPPERSG